MILQFDIPFNKSLIINEIHQLHLEPGHSNNWWRAETEESKKFWFKTDTWLKTIINNIENFHEINKINKLLNSDIVYVYKQLANSDLPTHRDWDVITAVNILLTDDVAPITIMDNDYHYKTALIDVSQPHSVKSYPKDRLLLKFAWHKKTFEEIKKELVRKCLI